MYSCEKRGQGNGIKAGLRNEVKSCEAGDFQFANTGAQSRIANVTNPPDQFPVLLLLMLGGVFGIALAKIVFVRRMAELRRKEQSAQGTNLGSVG